MLLPCAAAKSCAHLCGDDQIVRNAIHAFNQGETP